MKTTLATNLFKIIDEKEVFNIYKKEVKEKAIQNILSQSDEVLKLYYNYLLDANTNSNRAAYIAIYLFKNNSDIVLFTLSNILRSDNINQVTKIIKLLEQETNEEFLKQIITIISTCDSDEAIDLIYELVIGTNYSNNTKIKLANLFSELENNDVTKKIHNIIKKKIIKESKKYSSERHAIEDAKILVNAKGYKQAEAASDILDDCTHAKNDERVKIAKYASKSNTENALDIIVKKYNEDKENIKSTASYAKILSEIKETEVVSSIYKILANTNYEEMFKDEYFKILSLASKCKCYKTIPIFFDIFNLRYINNPNEKDMSKNMLEVLNDIKDLNDEEASLVCTLLANDYDAYKTAIKNKSYIELIHELSLNDAFKDNRYVFKTLDPIKNKENKDAIYSILNYALVSLELGVYIGDYLMYSNNIARGNCKYVDFKEAYAENSKDAIDKLEEIRKKYPNIDINSKTCYIRKRNRR